MNRKQTPEQIFEAWRDTLTKPDDSIFYYHPSVERIILGLALYDIASRPYLRQLSEAEPLTLVNLYTNEMITAWIDETDGFDYLFNSLVTFSEVFAPASMAYIDKHPALRKSITTLQYLFCFWTAVGGDMSSTLADRLLDDLATDGTRISSELISQLVKRFNPVIISQGFDFDMFETLSLVEEYGLEISAK